MKSKAGLHCSKDLPAKTLRLLGQSIEISDSPLILYGENYEIVYANPSARNFWPILIGELENGLSLPDALALQTQAISSELDKKSIVGVVRKTIDRLDLDVPTELFAIDGRSCRVTHRKVGKYTIGMGVEITDLKAREKELKKARIAEENSNRAKSEFLANMSHEIRTPMNGIMGMAQLLANGDLNKRETEFVNVIERSGQALLTIINDILDFSKIEAGHIVLDEAPFLLRESIEDVTTLLSSAVADTGVDLLLRVQPDLPTTYVGDVGRFRQVMTNLIGNAVKFTHEGHVLIEVSGQEVSGRMNFTIKISDTGIGIPADKLEHIFEKFSQVDGSTTREYEGTGLGLSIANNLVDLMGGTITAKSTVGKGSEFTLQFSLAPHDPIPAKPRIPANVTGANILVIDDNSVNRDIIKEQMQFWKCRCIAVESAKLGLAVLEKAHEKGIKIDLVIVDYQMPKMTGEDFVRAMKIDSKYDHIPTIMLSSVDQGELQKRMSNLGVQQFLTKPARSSVLLGAVGDAIYNRRKVSQGSSTGVIDKKPSPSVRSANALQSNNVLQDNHVDVLIAEDNDVNQIYIRYIMEDMGLTYKIVPNGRIAVDKWKLLSPKVVLMDISMPDMNGYEATKAIRKLEEKTGAPRTPIIAVTAHTLKGDSDHCFENDMDDYISKPLAISTLTQKLEKWGVMLTEEAKRKMVQ